MLSYDLYAQRSCGSEQYNHQFLHQPLELKSADLFEEWLSARRLDIPKSLRQSTEPILTIPVVFHVIHNGEDIGEGANLPASRLIEQVETLTEDFRRLNEDAADTPTDFLPVAADVGIEFVLARQDPEGMPTDGIVRVLGSKESYSLSDGALLAEISHWPSDEYLNVWVANIPNYLGFAQYPIANLPGLNGQQELNSQSDGVFVDYRYTGNNVLTFTNNEEFQSLGRTMTHEVGHWLGLRHIWGDNSSCSIDDYCADTPSQTDSTSGCPTNGGPVDCGHERMYQNYMDYTDDVCMNLFTTCQAERMRTVLLNSPRRLTLLESKGGEMPTLVANDLGIRDILSPSNGNCSASHTPTVEIRNYGSNMINNANLELWIDDNLEQTLQLSSLNLSSGQIREVQFETIIASQQSLVTFKVSSVNETTDGNPDNDCLWQSSVFPEASSIPIVEGFTQGLANWSTRNSSLNMSSWEVGTATNFDSDPDNQAAILLSASAVPEMGTLDYLISPVFDLTGVVTVDLSFRYAYSDMNDHLSDGLFIMVSTDCGATFPLNQIIFERWSPYLGTTSDNIENFSPEGSGDWRQEFINFGQFANEPNVVIAFAALNGGGNNLYIDDIEISSNNFNEIDASIVEISNTPVSTCQTSIQPSIRIKNLGLETIDRLNVRANIDGQEVLVSPTNLNILPGNISSIPLLINDLSIGNHELAISLIDPNGRQDDDPSNNQESVNVVVQDDVDNIPLKEPFNNRSSYEKWTFTRTDDSTDLVVYPVDIRSSALMFGGFNEPELNSENWFISPTLDLSDNHEAALRFEVSYAFREGRNERLQVKGSTNCGISYNELLYDKSGSELAVINDNQEWFPLDENHWRRETIDISALAGHQDAMIAFVITNQHGNNLFIDNIEFFDVAEPPELTFEQTVAVYPNPVQRSFQVAFNFDIKESVEIRVVSFSGDVMISEHFPHTLNQVFEIRDMIVPPGMYLVHVLGKYTNLTTKIVVAGN